jgi:hypothetical protein
MNKYVGLLASAGVCLPIMARAAGPSLDDVLTNSGITEAGHLSASYTGGFNKGQDLAYHAFDYDANSFELNQAAITLSKLPSDGFGALVNVTAGSDAKVINSSYGSGSGDFALTQGYVEYAHGPWTVIGGRYVTLAGAEVIDDSQDANVSRSLLFTLAEPLVHTGVRASYAISGTTTAYLGVNNSALSGDALDGDKTKTVETGLAYASADKKLGAAVYDYYGVDHSTKSNYLDLDLSYQLTDKLQLVANGDYFRFVGGSALAEPGTAVAAPGGYAAGAALYANYQISDQWKGVLRGEYLTTKDVLVTPAASGKSSIAEITGTIGYNPVKSVTLLGEVRYDFSNARVFPNPDFATFEVPGSDGDALKDQGAVEVKAIYAFGNASS